MHGLWGHPLECGCITRHHTQRDCFYRKIIIIIQGKRCWPFWREGNPPPPAPREEALRNSVNLVFESTFKAETPWRASYIFLWLKCTCVAGVLKPRRVGEVCVHEAEMEKESRRKRRQTDSYRRISGKGIRKKVYPSPPLFLRSVCSEGNVKCSFSSTRKLLEWQTYTVSLQNRQVIQGSSENELCFKLAGIEKGLSVCQQESRRLQSLCLI